MKVARTVSLTETVLEEVPDPVSRPGEVVCRVLACATCGSDAQDFYVSRELPAVLGQGGWSGSARTGSRARGGSAGTRRRAGGALCVYAPPPPGSPLAIDGNAVFMRELDVTASWSAGPADMRRALGLLARGAVRPLELTTHRFGLADTGAALAAQRSGEALKAVVLP